MKNTMQPPLPDEFITPQVGKLYVEDNLETLSRMKTESIGAIITDIPYGFSLQGNQWDDDLPSLQFLKECFRVQKSGAFFITTLVPRLDLQTEFVNRLHEAGYQTTFSPIYWAFCNGMSKAGKMVVDGVKTNAYAGFQPKPAVEVIITAMKPISQKTYIAQYQDNGQGVTYLRNGKIPYDTDKEGIRREGGIGNKVVGATKRKEYHIEDQEERLEGRSAPNLLCGHGFDTTLSMLLDAKKATQNISLAKVDVLFYAYLKNYKPLLVSMTEQENEMIAKLSVVYPFLQDCRITIEDFVFMSVAKITDMHARACDVLNDGNVSISSGGNGSGFVGKGFFMKEKTVKEGKNGIGYGDAGSNTRYFSIDAWWADRVSKLPESIKATFPFLFVVKPTQTEKNAGVTTKRNKNKRGVGEAFNSESRVFADEKVGNTHPTVKPVKLYAYLISLFCNPDEVIYEPFCGSGTTIVACETIGYKWIASEVSEDYADIAKKRIFNEKRNLKMFAL